MSSKSRFLLYVKAASDGLQVGDCPFSQRVMMYSMLKVPKSEVEIKPVDLTKKPDDFVKLNPEGKVPVLIDREKDNKIVADSAEITKYINEQFPERDCNEDYNGPALTACTGVFPKLAALIKNKDESQKATLKENLMAELKKVDDYLQSSDHAGKYLISDNLCEIDCMFLPRLRHVLVAGKRYGDITLPSEFKGLQKYIENAEQNEIYKETNCPDSEIIHGWSKHAS